jgi:cation transport regulator ChaC
MLRGIAFNEGDIGNHLRHSQEGLLGNDVTNLSEPEQELLAFIQSNARGGVRSTVKSVLERFEKKPYGWYYAAIICNVALLCARGKLEVRMDSNVLEDDELERALRNTHGYGSVLLEPQVEYTASQVRALKDFYAEFFDAPPRSTEAKTLARETAESFDKLRQTLVEIHAQVAVFPFLSVLTPVLTTLSEAAAKNTNWFLTELPRQKNALLDVKEQIIDPLRKFMGGGQKAIYEQATEFVDQQEDNFAYVQGDEASQIRSALADSNCYKGNRLQQVKAHLDLLQQKIADQRTREFEAAKASVDTLEVKLRGMPEFSYLGADQQAQVASACEKARQGLSEQKRIAMIRDQVRRFEDVEYPGLVAQIDLWSHPVEPGTKTAPPDNGGDTTSATTTPLPQPTIVLSRSIAVQFDKALLADEADLQRYLDALRDAWLKEIKAGKRVQI